MVEPPCSNFRVITAYFLGVRNFRIFTVFWNSKYPETHTVWAASWQNQQNGMCAQRRLRSAWASAQSDQSLHCPHEESLGPGLPIECTVKTLIRLGGCPGWSESSLGTHAILLVLSRGGSYSVYLVPPGADKFFCMTSIQILQRRFVKLYNLCRNFCRYCTLPAVRHWLFKNTFLCLSLRTTEEMDRVKRIWYLSPMRAAKVQASLRIRAVSPEPPLLAHTSSKSRGTVRQKARSLAPLNGWACAVEICHDGMLEDTNSLDPAQMIRLTKGPNLETEKKRATSRENVSSGFATR